MRTQRLRRTAKPVFLFLVGMTSLGLFVSPSLLHAAPVRVVSPGTGVFLGQVLVGRAGVAERSSAGADVQVNSAAASAFYSPSAEFLLGATVPWVDKRLEREGKDTADVHGVGDASLIGHWRFFQRVGRGSRDMAALRITVELPTGATGRSVSPDLDEGTRRALQPGSGGLDTTLLAAVGRAHYRYGFYANAWWRHNGSDGGWQVGQSAGVNAHAGIFVAPVQTRKRGFEIYTGVETGFEASDRNELRGTHLANSGGDLLWAAPFIQLIFGSRAMAEASLLLPVDHDPNGTQPKLDYSLVAGFRFVP